jgi:hypothetical protein
MESPSIFSIAAEPDVRAMIQGQDLPKTTPDALAAGVIAPGH